MQLTHITTYRFTPLTKAELPSLRDTLEEKLKGMSLKGSILLSTEGFNLSLAGKPDKIDQVKAYFNSEPLFCDLDLRESYAHEQPFKRMLVKIKSEIIAFEVDNIEPYKRPTRYITPKEFKKWYDKGFDMLVLDTRNNYEIQLGSFENATHLNIRKFKDFKFALGALANEDRKRFIVTYCTAGVRCEKAGPYLEAMGFENVYQLQGGIINYFKEYKGAHYRGECFVFDKRIAVDENLQETPTTQCWDCRSPLTVADQIRLEKACPYCGSVVNYTE